MKSFLLLCCVALALAGVALADDEEDRIDELMEKTHEGKRSPYRQLGKLLENKPPAWQTVDMQLPALEKMSKALAASKNKDILDAADGYMDAVQELQAAVTKRDLAGSQAAYLSLRKSCSDCHYKGGPGGKLEDEEDD